MAPVLSKAFLMPRPLFSILRKLSGRRPPAINCGNAECSNASLRLGRRLDSRPSGQRLVEFVALALAPQGGDVDSETLGRILERGRLNQDAHYLFAFELLKAGR
jgi:hypothetical protein